LTGSNLQNLADSNQLKVKLGFGQIQSCV
jgi:hypothetical protein